MPGFAERCRQLTEARADNPWLAEGPVIVQQQALKDHAQAMAAFFDGTHRMPDLEERPASTRGSASSRSSRATSAASTAAGPESGSRRSAGSGSAGLGPFRPDAKSYRVTCDRAGRWHVAFAVIPEPGPRTR